SDRQCRTLYRPDPGDGRGRCQLHDQLRRRQPHHRQSAADDHGEQPDNDLRWQHADADGWLHGLRQQRHIEQLEYSADGELGDGGDRQCRNLYRHDHGDGRGRCQLHDQLRRRQPHHRQSAADDYGEQPDNDLRRQHADADGWLHGLRQQRHIEQLEYSADGEFGDGSDRQCRNLYRHDHGDGRGRYQLHNQLRRRKSDDRQSATDDYGEQPDNDLRRQHADADGWLHGLRQQRHIEQLEYSADGEFGDGSDRQCRNLYRHDHGDGRGRCQLHDQLRRRKPDDRQSAADDYGEQPDNDLRRQHADADGWLHGLRQQRHIEQLEYSADGEFGDGSDRQCRNLYRHDHGDGRGRCQLHNQLRHRKSDYKQSATDNYGAESKHDLRRHVPDADRILWWFRQWRQFEQTIDRANCHIRDGGHGECGNIQRNDHSSRSRRYQLHDQLRRRKPHHRQGTLNGDSRQSNDQLRRIRSHRYDNL